MRQAKPIGDAGRDPDGPVGAGRDQAVDVLGLGEPCDRLLVLGGDDRAPVGEREADGRGVTVGRDDEQVSRARGAEQPELRGPRA